MSVLNFLAKACMHLGLNRKTTTNNSNNLQQLLGNTNNKIKTHLHVRFKNSDPDQENLKYYYKFHCDSNHNSSNSSSNSRQEKNNPPNRLHIFTLHLHLIFWLASAERFAQFFIRFFIWWVFVIQSFTTIIPDEKRTK